MLSVGLELLGEIVLGRDRELDSHPVLSVNHVHELMSLMPFGASVYLLAKKQTTLRFHLRCEGMSFHTFPHFPTVITHSYKTCSQ